MTAMLTETEDLTPAEKMELRRDLFAELQEVDTRLTELQNGAASYAAAHEFRELLQDRRGLVIDLRAAGYHPPAFTHLKIAI